MSATRFGLDAGEIAVPSAARQLSGGAVDDPELVEVCLR
jgi:hypothetical protein